MTKAAYSLEWPGYKIFQTLEAPAIQCLNCGKISYYHEDIRHLFCGHCHVFHADALNACAVPQIIERLIADWAKLR